MITIIMFTLSVWFACLALLGTIPPYSFICSVLCEEGTHSKAGQHPPCSRASLRAGEAAPA